MNNNENNQAEADRRLDALLGAHPVRVREDFAARTLERVRRESAVGDELDARMDALFAEAPVAPGSDFAARTLERIRSEAAQNTPDGAVRESAPGGKVVEFPAWARPAIGLAAAVALALLLLPGPGVFERGDAPEVVVGTPESPTIEGGAVGPIGQSAAPGMEIAISEEAFLDPELEEIFYLADVLGEDEEMLDSDALAVLAYLAE